MKQTSRPIRIDSEALITSARLRSGERPARGSGAMAAVKSQRAAIEALRRDGARWSDIAAALAEQGVTQGPARNPITAKRLTALLDSIRRKEEADAHREARLRQRKQVPLTRSPTIDQNHDTAADTARLGSEQADAVQSFEERQAARMAAKYDEIQRLTRGSGGDV